MSLQRLHKFFVNLDNVIKWFPNCQEIYDIFTVIYSPVPTPAQLQLYYSDKTPQRTYTEAGKFLLAAKTYSWEAAAHITRLLMFINLAIRILSYEKMKKVKIVYPGRSETVLLLISTLYPELQFDLWVEGEISIKMLQYVRRYPERINVIAKPLNNETDAAIYHGVPFIFYSFYRSPYTFPDGKYNAKIVDDVIDKDNDRHYEIIKKYKPLLSMIGVTIKYAPQLAANHTYSSMYGLLINTVYMHPSFNEYTHLIVKPVKKDVNVVKYESMQMYVRSQLRTLTLDKPEFETIYWTENGKTKHHRFENIDMSRLTHYTYDNYLLIRIYFHTFLTLEAVKKPSLKIKAELNDDFKPQWLVDHAITTTPALLAEFPKWLNLQLMRFEEAMDTTFTKAYISSRDLIIQKLTNELNKKKG